VSAVSAAAPAVGRVTQVRVARSEWVKLRSVRSTVWSLLVSLLLIIGIEILACVVFESRWTHLSLHERRDFYPLRANLVGVNFAQLAIGVLGVLVITARDREPGGHCVLASADCRAVPVERLQLGRPVPAE